MSSGGGTGQSMNGRSIAREASCTGVGLHTGDRVRVTLRPRGEQGIVFVREDLPGHPRVRACASNVVLERRRTALRDGDGEVHTAEHLLAALYASGVDAAEVGLSGPEVPGLDGSAAEWLALVRDAGAAPRPWERARIVLREAVAESAGTGAIAAVPCRGALVINYVLDHDTPVIPVQTLQYRLEPASFAADIAPARTFVLAEEVDALRTAGLGKGATVRNTLVVAADGVRDNELRFADEFVRHKVLDLLGDLSLLEAELWARVAAVRSGHVLNAALVRRIRAAAGAAEAGR
ncbi:MAG TPA: UDP-3-O-[3-hydroxymyristoyl] N-acetylglucosamine deacetylase [Planctomycetes bacterium]|nr:UDP-3-O-[3-hydroxymyristoyl] N-acetylglucosamine deacetylase [Planctomycetota bacterium]